MAKAGGTLDDRVWRELRKKIGALAASKQIKVGVLAAAGARRTTTDAGEITLVELAAIHEFGSPARNIPSRSFIRRTFSEPEGRAEMGHVLAGLARGVINDKLDVDQALGRLGAWAAGAIKRRIKMGIPPPLRPKTVKRKGSSTPLVDTGQLISSITWDRGK